MPFPTKRDLKNLNLSGMLMAGSFKPDTANAPTNLVGKGFASVVRTSAGLFTVTLDQAVSAVLAGGAHLQLATGDDKFAQLGTTANMTTSTKTFTIRVWDISGAAETDVAANANNVVHFWFLVKTSPAVG